jgi:hypothetical protein
MWQEAGVELRNRMWYEGDRAIAEEKDVWNINTVTLQKGRDTQKKRGFYAKRRIISFAKSGLSLLIRVYNTNTSSRKQRVWQKD